MKKPINAIYYNLVLFLLLIIGCNSYISESTLSKEEIRTAFQVVLDSAIRPTYYGKINYDIRGTFNYEYSDSLIIKSLSCIDTILMSKDIPYMINQYKELKGKQIDPYLVVNNFEVKESANYTSEDDIDYQFYLSPPLFTNDKKYFITYCIGTAIRPHSFADGFFFLFINENDKWYLHSIIKNDFTTPDVVSSKQSHSFIPKLH